MQKRFNAETPQSKSKGGVPCERTKVDWFDGSMVRGFGDLWIPQLIQPQIHLYSSMAKPCPPSLAFSPYLCYDVSSLND